MEFNARYVLTGIFSLAVIAAIFGFVYWLNNAGGFRAKSNYQVRFSVPVSGMATGGNVLFNGLKVGEITKLSYDQKKPSDFVAEISIDRDAPMREDTKAGIDYQGLTGAANILLTGGEPDSPKLVSKDNNLPVIVADPLESRSLTQNAGRVLRRIDEIFGNNSDRFESILAGLERMTGGGDADDVGRKHDLEIPEFSDAADQSDKPVPWQLVISEPTVVISMNTDSVQEEVETAVLRPFANAKWTDNLPNLLQSKIIQSFENAGFASAVLRSGDVLDAEIRLLMDIRSFHYRSSTNPAVVIDLTVKIVDSDGAVVAYRRFNHESPVGTNEPTVVVNTFGMLFSQTMKELVEWSFASL